MRYFESVFASRMQCPDPEVSVKLLMAFHEEKPLAAMFLILSAHRVTYLYGASATEGRHLMPTYALQWCAMQTARRADCSEYDLFGVAPNADPSHPIHGLYSTASRRTLAARCTTRWAAGTTRSTWTATGSSRRAR